MGVSRYTCLAIQSNPVRIIETPERWEAWIERNGIPHALVLSCSIDRKADLEKAVADIKAMPAEDIWE